MLGGVDLMACLTSNHESCHCNRLSVPTVQCNCF